jgi:hypothetical protein
MEHEHVHHMHNKSFVVLAVTEVGETYDQRVAERLACTEETLV